MTNAADAAAALTGSIVGLGNPLLDICADVDQDLLDRYGLKVDDATIADESLLPLYDELTKNLKPVFAAGGATQNSIRVAQWMLNKVNQHASSFFGAVGKDEHADRLRECAEHDHVRVHYYVNPELATGTCAVCVLDTERSLVANLAAANTFDYHHLENATSQEILKAGQFFYSSGFHLTASPPAMMLLAKHAHANNKVFLVNLSAPFIAEGFHQPLSEVIAYADYVFGNETEALAFGKVREWGNDLTVIAQRLSQLPKESGARCRTVVFTQGSQATIVAHDGIVETFAVPKVPASEIVDTNGAGDSFVGGFLSRLALRRPLADCVNAGHWAAQAVLRRSGCTFPDECTYSD